MIKELEFLEEKHGDNSWGYYPPSKQEVAQWLQEWTEKQFAIHDVMRRSEQLKAEQKAYDSGYNDGAQAAANDILS